MGLLSARVLGAHLRFIDCSIDFDFGAPVAETHIFTSREFSQRELPPVVNADAAQEARNCARLVLSMGTDAR